MCCPVTPGAHLHMTFSAPVDRRRDAEAFRARLEAHGPPTLPDAPCLGPWGPNSRLYGVDHPLYCNDRPPHVAGGPDGPVSIHIARAYVCAI